MTKQITFDEEASKKIALGVNKLANVVKTTLGPGGSNVILERQSNHLITKDGVTVSRDIYLEDPIENIGAQIVKEAANKTAEGAGDGPQPLYAKVLTPFGWTEMGNLSVGDFICGTNGTMQTVTGIFPKGTKEIYQVKLRDKTVIECCEDHLWKVKYDSSGHKIEKTLPLKNIIERGIKNRESYKFSIPISFAEFVMSSRQKIDPYFLGLLIGDGYLGKSPELSIGYAKEHTLSKIILPDGMSMKKFKYEKKKYYKIRFTNDTILKNLISELGLLNVHSENKFIPRNYLYAPKEARERLLQGLLDTDGHLNKRGVYEFSSTSKQLALDVKELFNSLGKKVNFNVKTNRKSAYGKLPVYVVVEMSMKNDDNKIVSITKTGKTTLMQCIRVSNEDCLYFTDGYTLTHNTTTATVLAQAIFNEGLKNIAAGANRMDLKRGIDIAVKVVVEQLKKIAKPVADGDLMKIATISANGDTVIAQLIVDAISKVGRNGIVTVTDTKGLDSYVKVVEGVQFDRGWLSAYFITDQQKQEVDFRNCQVMLYDGVITHFKELVPFFDTIRKTQSVRYPLLVVADDIQGDALSTMALNHINGAMACCAVQSPDMNDKRKEHMKDLAAVTGATIIAKETGFTLTNAPADVLGMASQIRISQWSTTVIGGKGAISDEAGSSLLKVRIATLEEEMKEANVQAQEALKYRLARLRDGMAVIYVGGSTDVEIREKKDRIDDALQATRAAMDEGIVPGGGVAYVRVREEIDGKIFEGWPKLGSNQDEITGVSILRKIMDVPFKAIIENIGWAPDVVLNKIANDSFASGFNAKTLQYCDLIEAGVIDPVKVSRLALENAASVAGMLLTTKSVVSNIKPTI